MAGDEPVRPVVVGADTVVVVDGRVLGKPRDEAEILTHLEWLSGRTHDVLSAVAVVSGHGASPRAEIYFMWMAEHPKTGKTRTR